MSFAQIFSGSQSAASADDTHWHGTEPWVRFGMRVVVYMCGGLLLAFMVLSISGAVVAIGTVSVDGQYKAVQHLEGGIVSKIEVRNGDRVAANQVLVRMDDTQVRANYQAASSKVAEFALQEARLIAERDLKERFEPPGSIDVTKDENAKILLAQQALFTARRSAYAGQRVLLKERVTQAERELESTKSQLSARNKERKINSTELAKLKPLFEKGYVGQQRISALEREAASLSGDIGALEASVGKLKAAIAEAEARLLQTDKEYVERAADDLQRVQAGLSEQAEAERALSDRLERTLVRAPVAGFVHALTTTTEGSVIQPGAGLMQIVPDGQQFTVEAKVAPNDIDSVHKGQIAHVRFTSFDSHTTPRLDGIVRKVSAAELKDDQGHTYFTVQVEVPPTELARLDQNNHLVPGMPAEVYLQTHDRSILSYFLKPLSDMLARTFRER